MVKKGDELMENLHLKKSIVLVVDDSLANLGAIFNFLEEAGLEVIVAQDGEIAIQKLEYTLPDLILLDVMMPGMDGLEICKILKENPSTREIPVIFMTALSNTEDKVKGFMSGAVDYITKPFQKEEVLARINIHLERQSLIKALAHKNQLLQEKIEEKNEVQNALQLLNHELEHRVEERTSELSKALKNLQQTQLQLVQIEKMSALGQLVAGVAHEINNPVGFISGNLDHAEHYIQNLIEMLRLYQQQFPSPGTEIVNQAKEIDLDYLIEDLPHLVASMKVGVERIRQISNSLRTFSRSDSKSPVAANIHDGIDSTLLILKHRLKANNVRPAIEVIKSYDDLPEIYCYPGQLNQVFMNILANAIDAIEEVATGKTFKEIKHDPTRIIISTELEKSSDFVIIKIMDNGVGMSEEVKQRIFDHQFTTKPVGKGTGLGLSIARQIVEKEHGGKLSCVSSPKEGTAFIIKIPLKV
jgi:signal transduction histidine kinase